LLARACVRGEKKLQPTARERDTWIFLILTFFKLFIKLTPGKHYLHQVTPFAMSGGATDRLCRATCSGAAGVPWWRGAARGADVGPGLPRHMHRRGSLAAASRLARQG
jgi:hypothetical protein